MLWCAGLGRNQTSEECQCWQTKPYIFIWLYMLWSSCPAASALSLHFDSQLCTFYCCYGKLAKSIFGFTGSLKHWSKSNTFLVPTFLEQLWSRVFLYSSVMLKESGNLSIITSSWGYLTSFSYPGRQSFPPIYFGESMCCFLPLGSCVQWRVVRECPDVQHQTPNYFSGNKPNLFVCVNVCAA